MSMNIEALAPDVEDFNCSLRFWNQLMCDLPFGAAIGIKAHANGINYTYRAQDNSGSPLTNDGYLVTAQEAQKMVELGICIDCLVKKLIPGIEKFQAFCAQSEGFRIR